MISNYFAAALLNHFMNANAMPNIPTLYIGICSGIPSGEGVYAEVSTSVWTNYKRAGVARSTVGFPLVTTGRVISNAADIGNGTAGSLNSFLSTGTGATLSGTSSLTLNAIDVWDAATAGNRLFQLAFSPLNGATSRALANNGVFYIAAGKFQASFTSSVMTDFEARNYLNVAFNGMGFTRGYYEIGLLTDLAGTEVTTTQWTNYKRARLTRNSTNFPVVTGNTLTNGVIIGNGAVGTDNCFLSSGTSISVPSSLAVKGDGIYDHQNVLCWAVPCSTPDGNFVLTNGASISEAVGSMALMIS